MGLEIERKFLVKDDAWRDGAEGEVYKQGYLAIGPPASVRVRLEGKEAKLNIKRSTLDIAREEFEYSIPVADAEAMLELCCAGRIVEKVRYKIPYAGLTWEVDEFGGANAGLVVAEVELSARDQSFEQPPWVGEEVSGDARYLNSSLSRHPYCEW